MRNIVVGCFLGCVLAAAFLAACGSGSGEQGAGPVPLSTPSAVKWTPLGARQTIATGVNLTRSAIWRGTAIYDNAEAGARHQYATLDLGLNVDAVASADVTVDIGILPAAEGAFFATDPIWLGGVELASGDNRRTSLVNVRIPPMRCMFALRLRSSASATARVLTFGVAPYDAELQ